jgi:hypothetical protein
MTPALPLHASERGSWYGRDEVTPNPEQPQSGATNGGYFLCTYNAAFNASLACVFGLLCGNRQTSERRGGEYGRTAFQEAPDGTLCKDGLKVVEGGQTLNRHGAPNLNWSSSSASPAGSKHP